MGIEMIIGLATALLAVIAGAFGLGHSRGTSKAEAKAEQQRTEENAAAVAAAERKAEVTKGASDVQQTVSHMPDDDVDRELRERFTRPGGG
jgi:NAD/NADP transhydrogenase beta subunit